MYKTCGAAQMFFFFDRTQHGILTTKLQPHRYSDVTSIYVTGSRIRLQQLSNYEPILQVSWFAYQFSNFLGFVLQFCLVSWFAMVNW